MDALPTRSRANEPAGDPGGTAVRRADPSGESPGTAVRRRETSWSVRRLGSAVGLVTIGVIDLLALEDIATSGASMPEIGFLVVSVPALVTLAWLVLRRGPADPGDPGDG